MSCPCSKLAFNPAIYFRLKPSNPVATKADPFGKLPRFLQAPNMAGRVWYYFLYLRQDDKLLNAFIVVHGVSFTVLDVPTPCSECECSIIGGNSPSLLEETYFYSFFIYNIEKYINYFYALGAFAVELLHLLTHRCTKFQIIFQGFDEMGGHHRSPIGACRFSLSH